jgi:hypothetical protein
MPTILGQIAFAFELRNRGRIRGVAVGVDHPRRGMVRSAQRFGRKAGSVPSEYAVSETENCRVPRFGRTSPRNRVTDRTQRGGR